MDEKVPSCCSVQRPQPSKGMPIPANHSLSMPAKARAVLDGMVFIAGGEYYMGTDSKEAFPQDGEGPVHKVRLKSFYIASCTVTNAQFLEFVEATGYKTEAEEYDWSFVFAPFLDKSAEVLQTVPATPWWAAVKGACWNKPEGFGTSIEDRMDHPVVHVSWNDAIAYCLWLGVRLPSEAEWEFAARGGLHQKMFPWGDELTPKNEHRCNIWQGKFPDYNSGEDGFISTAPAKFYRPNGYGLYNASGNIWEWCSDWFSRQTYLISDTEDPRGPKEGTERVIRGGSYLCHESYCNRYRVSARSSNTPDSSTGHMGFRIAFDA